MLDHAAESDETIRQKWEEWEEAVSRLTWEEEDLEQWVPSSTVPTAGRKDASNLLTQNHARALRVQLEALDDLRTTRGQIVQRARRLADADNIQPRIMRQASGIERWTDVEPAMFESTLDEEMNKYEKFKDSIEEVTEKQDELLEQMKARYEQFIQSRKEDKSVKEREHALQTLDLGYHKYREILRDLEEGLRFYNDLGNILIQFREACKDWVRTRRDETRWLSQNLDRLRISDEDPSTPKGSSVNLQEEVTASPKPVPSAPIAARGAALDLPPPDSDEWEETPYPVAQQPSKKAVGKARNLGR